MHFMKCIAVCFALLPVLAFSAEFNLGKSIEFDDEVTPPTETYHHESVGSGYVCEIRMPYTHIMTIVLRTNADCQGAEIQLRLCNNTADGISHCPVSGDYQYTYKEAQLALAVKILQHAMDNSYRVWAYRSSYYSQIPDFDHHSVQFAHTFSVEK